MSILFKTVSAVMLVLAVILAFLGWYFIGHETAALEREINQRMTYLAGDLARQSQPHILSRDTDRLAELAEKTLRQQDILVVHITDDRDSILALAEKNILGPTGQVIIPVKTVVQTENASDLNVIGKIKITYSLVFFNQQVGSLRAGVLLAVFIALVAAGLMVFYISRRLVSEPLKKIAAVSRQIKQGDLEVKIELNRNDELGSLADMLNEIIGDLKLFRRLADEYRFSMDAKMAEKTKELNDTHEQLIQAGKIAAIGTLSGGLAHDFNNILFAITGNAELLKMELDPSGELYKMVTNIEVSARKGSELTQKLLSFAQRTKLKPGPTDLNRVISAVVDSLKHTLDQTVKLEFHQGQNLPMIQADPAQLYQVILNICANAREAMEPKGGGQLTIKTDIREFSETDLGNRPGIRPGRYLVCSISDTGIGIDPAELPRIFEPFYTTKQADKGIGLGLSVIYDIVKAHKGIINVVSKSGRGSRFDVCLPALKETATQPEPTAKAESKSPPPDAAGILVIDDEAGVREMVKTMLERLGYRVLTAPDGQTGLETYSQNKDEIKLVILDLIMPGLSGLETLKKLRQLHPTAKVIISTGFTGQDQNQEIINAGSAGFIYKPYSLKQLADQISRVINN